MIRWGPPGRFNCALTGGILWCGGAVNRSSTDGIFLGRREYLLRFASRASRHCSPLLSSSETIVRELKYERCVLRDGRDMFVIRFSIFNKWEALRYGVAESVTKVCNYLKMEN